MPHISFSSPLNESNLDDDLRSQHVISFISSAVTPVPECELLLFGKLTNGHF